MTKAFFYLLAGILAGFGVLFFTVWGDAVPDARGLAGALFAIASSLILLSPYLVRKRCDRGID